MMQRKTLHHGYQQCYCCASMSDFVDMPVISGGIFPFNQIKASADGQIFTANLYKW